MEKKTRGRKPISESQYESKRRDILFAANQLFSEKGFSGVSMRQLARKTQMSPMSLYRYFENKRAILIHIWADVFERVFADCHKSAQLHSDPANALEAFGVCFVEYWVDNPQDYLMIYCEIDTPARSEHFFTDSKLIRSELAYIQNMLEEAGVPVTQSSNACQQVLCVLNGVSHSLVTIPELNWAPAEQLVPGLIKGLIMQNQS